MAIGSVQNVLFVHGYSVSSLNSFKRLPALLQNEGVEAVSMFLSAFITLDDDISCDDLAGALERRIALLEKTIDMRKTMIIAHSTGAIVVRRWLLDRLVSGGTMPSHFLSAAGANHGSTMAQLGQTALAHLFRSITQRSSVGARVLDDLDYGSVFLRKLNRDWLDAWNASSPLYSKTFCFSIGGTDHSFWENQLAWQSRESGSDGTVRISGANLNYRFIELRPPYTGFTTTVMNQPCPHLVVQTPARKYSHTSQSEPDTLGLVLSGAADVATEIAHFGRPPEAVSSLTYGILEGILSQDEQPFQAIVEAMNVADLPSYQVIQKKWVAEMDAWTQANPSEANSTAVVATSDQFGRVVDHASVIIRDQNGTIQNISASILGNQPISNRLSPSVISYYINTGEFRSSHPHAIHIEAGTGTQFATYGLSLDAPISDDENHVLGFNEFTYVDVRVFRDASAGFVLYSQALPTLEDILNQEFPPFPPGSISA